MEKVLKSIVSVKDIKTGQDDYFSDRLSRIFTTSLLVICVLIVTTKQFVGEPINCWCPAYFTESHRYYTNSICWISNTFYVPFENRIPEVIDEEWKSRQLVCYYQWVPIILISMSVLTIVPALVWRILSIRSGLDVLALLDSANTGHQAGFVDLREKSIRYVSNQIDRYLQTQREYKCKGCCTSVTQSLARWCFLVGGRRYGNYLTICYLVVKLLYIVNIVGQLFLLEYFLGIDYIVYGLQAVYRAVQGQDWRLTESFPRVTLCAFQIRHQARIHDYVVQCALAINLFNEKIFLVIWFWYVVVLITTVASAVVWLFKAIYWPYQLRFIRRRLRDIEVCNRSKTMMPKFVQSYLHRDGLFLIQMISSNVGEIIATEILAVLWENYGPKTQPDQIQPQQKSAPPQVRIRRGVKNNSGGGEPGDVEMSAREIV